jgi:hypothetical protein
VRTLEFGKDIKAIPLKGVLEEAPVLPAGLVINVEKNVHYEEPCLKITGELQNPTTKELSILALAPFPFQLAFAEDEKQVMFGYATKGYGDGKMEILEIKIPEGSALAFISELNLSYYAYENEPKVELTWIFNLLQNPPIQGNLTAVLPARKTSDFYYINSRFVSEKEFDEFKNSLNGQERWYCEETSDAEQTGWVAKDSNGRSYQIKYNSTKKAGWDRKYSWSEIYLLE